MTSIKAIEASIKDTTQLIWIESPSNPLLKITDIRAVSALAKSRGIIVACDNTWTPPPMQPVFALGADIVMHATTKYLAGHSDVTGGAVISKEDDEFFARIRFIQQYEGAVPSPFDTWLIQRGLKSLAYRMRGHCDNAQKLAAFLAGHPKVERVHYPSLASHPQHSVAAQQMTTYGGMMSIQIKGGEGAAMAVAASVKLFTRATSLGGVESLIEHRASIEGEGTRTPTNLLRISVGLEHPDDLIEDIAQALDLA
jgi:cystathionine gamma-synthase